ncbi:MAG: anhydro-N-acetylmuramic acid kinase, partial [Gammaproteobacteria bacterium]|nr:anhydro-N-acetylmuramic acid kinase [Gammaproteobacteria bacterium]
MPPPGRRENSTALPRVRHFPGHRLSDWGIDPRWIEAAAFTWLARQRIHGRASNLPSVTGATASISLGGLFLPPER